jgi:hypothetical protein
MRPRQPFAEELPGGLQLRLFGEETEIGSATTAGPAPGLAVGEPAAHADTLPAGRPSPDTDSPDTPRTEP